MISRTGYLLTTNWCRQDSVLIPLKMHSVLDCTHHLVGRAAVKSFVVVVNVLLSDEAAALVEVNSFLIALLHVP